MGERKESDEKKIEQKVNRFTSPRKPFSRIPCNDRRACNRTARCLYLFFLNIYYFFTSLCKFVVANNKKSRLIRYTISYIKCPFDRVSPYNAFSPDIPLLSWSTEIISIDLCKEAYGERKGRRKENAVGCVFFREGKKGGATSGPGSDAHICLI